MCMRCPWMDIWLAVGGDELLSVISNSLNGKKFWKRWSPERQKCKICLATKNGDALKQYIFAICENHMHRNRNLDLKMGVSPAAHTCQAIHTECPPPPPPAGIGEVWRLCDDINCLYGECELLLMRYPEFLQRDQCSYLVSARPSHRRHPRHRC